MLSFDIYLFMMVPPQSIDATVLRQKGCMVSSNDSRWAWWSEKNVFSDASTASEATKLGYMRSQPRGSVHPWNITCMP